MSDLVGGAGGGEGWSGIQRLRIGRGRDSEHPSDCESLAGGVAADAATILRAADDRGAGGTRELTEPDRRRAWGTYWRCAADTNPEDLLREGIGQTGSLQSVCDIRD